MCIEIHYLYPTCSCLAKVGKYTCYTARTSTTPNKANSARSDSTPSSGAGTPRNPFSDEYAISIPEITITSASGTTSPFSLYGEHPLSTFTTAPLSLSPSKNNLAGNGHQDNATKFTIRTLLSHRVENISQVDVLGISKFDVQCEHFKVTEQLMRTGSQACKRCSKRIERGELESEQERLKREEEGESKKIWDMLKDGFEAIRKREDASVEMPHGEVGSLGSENRGEESNRGLRNMDEVERELRDIQRYVDHEEGRESWESVGDDEELELLIDAADVKRPKSSFGRRRSDGQ